MQEEDEEEHQQTGGAERVSEGAGDGEEPSAKRVKFAAEAAEHDGPSTSGQALPEEQVLLALSKIRSHIGNASKFAKASALLRQLFDTRAITRACRDDAFMVVRAAFPTFKAAFASDVHRDYMRLCHCIDRHQDALSKAQRAHFAIYYIAGGCVTCNCGVRQRAPLRVARAQMSMHGGSPVHTSKEEMALPYTPWHAPACVRGAACCMQVALVG